MEKALRTLELLLSARNVTLAASKLKTQLVADTKIIKIGAGIQLNCTAKILNENYASITRDIINQRITRIGF